jgi:hypothetical protein
VPELNIAWDEKWLWLGGSLLAAIIWTNLTWFFRKTRSGPVGEFCTGLISSPFSPWVLQFLRLLYYLGVPFAALLWGHDAIIKHTFGLQQLALPAGNDQAAAEIAANWQNWAQDAGWAAALGFGAWALLASGWCSYRRALTAIGENSALTGINSSGWVFLREAAYHQVHWAFYCNAPMMAMEQQTGDRYWGVWIGLALVALEAMLNPAWRAGLSEPTQAPVQLMRGVLAIFSGVLFLQTENLWGALAVHWGVSWGLAALIRMLPSLPAREPDRISP